MDFKYYRKIIALLLLVVGGVVWGRSVKICDVCEKEKGCLYLQETYTYKTRIYLDICHDCMTVIRSTQPVVLIPHNTVEPEYFYNYYENKFVPNKTEGKLYYNYYERKWELR